MKVSKVSQVSLLRVLSSLRWFTVVGQAISILVATGPMGLPLAQTPLWGGVALLALFNAHTHCYLKQRRDLSVKCAFFHIFIDICQLAWMILFSGGIDNPFGSLFIVFIALAALAFSPRWQIGVGVACLVGYSLSAIVGLPLPRGRFDSMALRSWGMEINFLLSAIVVLVFSRRLSNALRERDHEIAALRERSARNEGIIALATHAASVAHALNTPLATMTLLTDEIRAQCPAGGCQNDLDTLRGLLAHCHQQVLELAAPADPMQRPIAVKDVLEQWQRIRPTICLRRNTDAPLDLLLAPSLSHLLLVLLNNAADAGEQNGHPEVDFQLRVYKGELQGEVRDHGIGFHPSQSEFPGTLFTSSKVHGMGLGLALSHATVERLHGKLWMLPGQGGGACVGFRVLLGETG